MSSASPAWSWRHGGDEEKAIAALLHDAAEDQGGHAMLARIEARFGSTVSEIVRGCSDSLDQPNHRGESASSNT